MQLISGLRGAGLIEQATEFGRGLRAEWRRLVAWCEVRIEGLVGEKGTLNSELLPMGALRAVNDRLGGLLDKAFDRGGSELALARPREIMAERMSEERQWALATREFQSSSGAAEHAALLHQSAALQIDAAVYALDGLFYDLRSVMSVGYRGDVFAHQADYTEQHSDTLYAAAVMAAVGEIKKSQHVAGKRRAA